MVKKSDDIASGQQFVRDALEIGALELVPEGRALKNGRISPYFFNSGLFNSGAYSPALGRAFASAIRSSGVRYSTLYGPPYKGFGIVIPAAEMLAKMKLPNTYVMSRKEAKDHGEGGVLIGAKDFKGQRVLILDDVITDGGTKREAVELITSLHGALAGLVVAFDRSEWREESTRRSAAEEFERDFNVPVIKVADVHDLIAVLEKGANENELWARAFPKILAYQKKYGV